MLVFEGGQIFRHPAVFCGRGNAVYGAWRVLLHSKVFSLGLLTQYLSFLVVAWQFLVISFVSFVEFVKPIFFVLFLGAVLAFPSALYLLS